MRRTHATQRIEKDDPQPVTPALLRRFAAKAADTEAAVLTDPELRDCAHVEVDNVSVFCGECGALVSVRYGLGLVRQFGAAFALQQIFNGMAIANAQERSATAHARLQLVGASPDRVEAWVRGRYFGRRRRRQPAAAA